MNATKENPENEPLWTVDETAKFLKMSKNWVYRRTGAGEIPHGKFGRVIRYSPARIREYRDQRIAEGSSPNVVSLAGRRPRRKGGR